MHPLYNPGAGPVRPGHPPARYPNRAECVAALRAGIDAATNRIARQPAVKLGHLANTAALAVLDCRPPPTMHGQVRQAEMVVLANWIGEQVRGATAEGLTGLLDDFDALCAAAPIPEE